MRSKYITAYSGNNPHILKPLDSTPESGFFTPWLRCNGGFFRIHLTIVGVEPKQPESYFPLSKRETEAAIEAISDVVKLLTKESGRQYLLR